MGNPVFGAASLNAKPDSISVVSREARERHQLEQLIHQPISTNHQSQISQLGFTKGIMKREREGKLIRNGRTDKTINLNR